MRETSIKGFVSAPAPSGMVNNVRVVYECLACGRRQGEDFVVADQQLFATDDGKAESRFIATVQEKYCFHLGDKVAHRMVREFRFEELTEPTIHHIRREGSRLSW